MPAMPTVAAVHEGMQPEAGKKRQQQKQAAEGNMKPVLVDQKQGGKRQKTEKGHAPARPGCGDGIARPRGM